MKNLIKKIIKEALDEALKDEIPDYMIKAVKSNNPDLADKYLDMDVPKHNEIIPDVKIEIKEPNIRNQFINQIQEHFKESILNQYNQTAVSKYSNDLKFAKIIAKSLNVSPKIILGLSRVNYLKVLYSKNFSLLQGKDNTDINNPIFSNNKSNLFTFVKSFIKAFPQYQVKLDEFLNDRIFTGLREPIMNFDENVMDLAKSKLYLYITDKPADILRMSVSNFYSSCQNLYSGAFNEQLLSNIFDENSKIAYLIFDSPYIDNQGNKHPFTPIARTIIRVGNDNKIMFDVVYPQEMENQFYNIIENYTNLKNEGEEDDSYPYKQIELPEPYMDKYRITSNIPLEKNKRALTLAKFLNINVNQLTEITDDYFKYNNIGYTIYTEREANEEALDEFRRGWREELRNQNFYDLIEKYKILKYNAVTKILNYNNNDKITFKDFLKKENIITLRDFEDFLKQKFSDFYNWYVEEQTYNMQNLINFYGGMQKMRKNYIGKKEYKINDFYIYTQ